MHAMTQRIPTIQVPARVPIVLVLLDASTVAVKTVRYVITGGRIDLS
jgi:hypothetical protein